MIYVIRLFAIVLYQVFEGSLTSLLLFSTLCTFSIGFLVHFSGFVVRYLLPVRDAWQKGVLYQATAVLALAVIAVGLFPCMTVQFSIHDIVWVGVMVSFTFLSVMIRRLDPTKLSRKPGRSRK
jgi:hypothetical protein